MASKPKSSSRQDLVIDDYDRTIVEMGARKTRNYLIVVCFVLLIIAVTFVSLYVLETRKANDAASSATSPSVQDTLSAQDVAVSAAIFNSMDKTVDPCVDFYKFSCGNWLKRTPIPDSRSRYSRFAELSDKNQQLLKHSLQELFSKQTTAGSVVVQNAANYYKACMDKKGIVARGDAPLKQMIADYGSWPVTDNAFDAAKWNFDDIFTRVQKDLGVPMLFTVYVGEDLKNSSRNAIIFDQPSLRLSRTNFLGNVSYNIKVRSAYRNYAKALVTLMGANETGVKMIDELFNFETKLAEKSLSVNERRDYLKIYSAMSVKAFSNETGMELPWLLRFLNSLFPGQQKVKETEMIISFSTNYIRDAYKMFKALSVKLQAAYLIWPSLKMMAETLLGDYQDAYNAYSETISGTTEVDPRWQKCVSSTMGSYNFALSRLFVEKTFTREAKAAAEEMISGVRSVFIDNLKDLKWMDEETKKAAGEKALGIIENIGYPEYILDDKELEKKFKGLDSKADAYFENILNRRKFYRAQGFKKRGKPVDKTEWKMYPTAVNAYYSPPENKIVFPAGILQPPFYDFQAPRALNYGAIGMVVGHEITHGFDDQGRQFDKNGNVRSWWSASSVTNFKNKAKCLVDQYSKFSLFNKTQNGNQTLGENIADNGGIKASLQAYRNYVAKHGPEKELPGLGLTSEQLYFVGFAQVWCSAYRESAAISQIDSGYHSLSNFRVKGTVQNSDDFSKAFKCKAGSPMNPPKKCTLW